MNCLIQSIVSRSTSTPAGRNATRSDSHSRWMRADRRSQRPQCPAPARSRTSAGDAFCRLFGTITSRKTCEQIVERLRLLRQLRVELLANFSRSDVRIDARSRYGAEIFGHPDRLPHARLDGSHPAMGRADCRPAIGYSKQRAERRQRWQTRPVGAIIVARDACRPSPRLIAVCAGLHWRGHFDRERHSGFPRSGR